MQPIFSLSGVQRRNLPDPEYRIWGGHDRIRKLLETRSTKGQRLIALAFWKGKIRSVGYNEYAKTHPVQRLCAIKAGSPKREYLHAEISAIVKAKGPIDELFVMRVDKSGKSVTAAPCAVCRLAIKMAGIKRVYHT